MANKFKLGDTVKCTCAYSGNEWIKDQIGTVCHIYSESEYGIDFDKDVGGHTCNDTCIEGHGWAIPAKYLERAIPKEAKILIYHMKNTVIAKLLDGKKVIAQSTAQCSPDDTFNFLTGAQIALLRLARTQHVKHIIPKEAFESFEII